MPDNKNLKRYLDAQTGVYESALKEIGNGRKIGHWMWYIFPQISGLGFSETSRRYALQNRGEARAYLNHEILGARLIEISETLLRLQTNNPIGIFGSVDSLKLKSSMTLFSLLEPTDPVFQKVLDKFYAGEKDPNTLRMLE